MITRQQVAEKLLAYFGRIKISEQTFLILLSFMVGIGGGLGAVIFRWLIAFFNKIFFGYGMMFFYSITKYGGYLIFLIPVIGGLIIAPITYRLVKESRGHGVPEVMLAVATKGGVIRPPVAVAKSIASSICIGSGGSVGREGPIIQIGSALGSSLGQMFGMSGERVRILVGCGAAAGIAATFNAPIAGVLFALEIILGDFAITAFGPVIISSFVASIISRAALGNHPAFVVPAYSLINIREIPLYMLLGVLAGVIAVVFIKVLYESEDIFEKLRMNNLLKPALGGLILGLIGIFYPQIFGVGYDVITAALHNQILFYTMLALVFFKIVGTSLTLGSGGSGGIFAPSLFTGAMLGGTFGVVVHTLFPSVTAAPGAYALVGMSALVAGTTHAPITAIVMIFEMTGDYRIILPVMLTSVLSTIVSNKLNRESIYTLKLIRQGIDIRRGKDVAILTSTLVKDVMSKNWEAVDNSMPLGRLLPFVESSKDSFYPVVDHKGELEGILSLQDIRTLFTKQELENLIIVKDILRSSTVTVSPNETLMSALQKFGLQDVEALPVVDKNNPKRLLGILRRADLVNYYNKKLVEKASRSMT